MIIAVGSYTETAGHVPEARGAGISILELDDQSMEARTRGVINAASPSYLTFDKKNGHIYAVSEASGKPVDISTWHLEEDGGIEPLKSAGKSLSGCHLSLSPDGNQLFTASYEGGLLTCYELKNGRIGSIVQSISYSGSGPNTERQEAPHAHQVVPEPAGSFLYVCDLGSDRIWKHRIKELEETPSIALRVPPGYGPRHMTFGLGNELAYILCELVPRILVVSVDGVSGNMKIVQELDSTVPEFINKAAPAAVKLHPSGRTLAVSNRFDDTISIFTLDGENGTRIALAENFLCRGRTPRDINFSDDGSILFIANQDSHDIQLCSFNKETGLPTGSWGPKIEIGSPACVINL